MTAREVLMRESFCGPTVVANPRQVRDVAKATGQLAKTDAWDADLLALFAERVCPTPRPLPDAAVQPLDALIAATACTSTPSTDSTSRP